MIWVTCIPQDLYQEVDTRVIVKDCEAVRESLLGSKEGEEDRKWILIGQSYGGVEAPKALERVGSQMPESISVWLILPVVFITGGLPPPVDHPDCCFTVSERRALPRTS